MPDRILVAYATHTGSTAEVATVIGEELRGRGFDVDVAAVNNAAPVRGYQAVVLGSAVNGGRWLPEALEFVSNHHAALSAMPVAVFCVHIMNAGDDERSRRKRMAYLEDVRRFIRPVDEAFFLGIGPDPKKESWLARWTFRRFGGAGEGDCRDWEKIRQWARGVLAEQLGAPMSAMGSRRWAH
jgi:menaquinone-dependent protoporphyrinogen oxidase